MPSDFLHLVRAKDCPIFKISILLCVIAKAIYHDFHTQFYPANWLVHFATLSTLKDFSFREIFLPFLFVLFGDGIFIRLSAGEQLASSADGMVSLCLLEPPLLCTRN